MKQPGVPEIRQRFVVTCLAGQPGHEGTRDEIQAVARHEDPVIRALMIPEIVNATLQQCVQIGWLARAGSRGRVKNYRVTTLGLSQVRAG